jgi:hypothetical protein
LQPKHVYSFGEILYPSDKNKINVTRTKVLFEKKTPKSPNFEDFKKKIIRFK